MSIIYRADCAGTSTSLNDDEKEIEAEGIDIIANNVGANSNVTMVSKKHAVEIGVSSEDVLRAIAGQGEEME